MVILGKWRGNAVTISVKPNCLTVSIETASQTEVYSFDYTGRLWTALIDQVSYRRGLDGKIAAKWQTDRSGRDRRWLSPSEARQIETRARQSMHNLYRDLQSGQGGLQAELPALAITGFERAIAFDQEASKADIAHYHRVYKPVGILPPDQYMAVVLQATEGCAFNTCTFCDFYRDRPFRIKSSGEFHRHIEQVKEFLGEGLSLRRTIFLGDANALIVPMPKLLPLMDVIHQSFDVQKLGGVYAFLDGFSGGRKTASDYRRLAGRGLVRAYVGMESGYDPLLKALKKPGQAADAVNAVNAMKAGGVSVGVIVLLGAGGKTWAKEHVRATISALNLMRLDEDDLLYFSELILSEGLQYVKDAYHQDWQPLSQTERLAQGDEIESRLRFSTGGLPHISRYDIREFVY
jgi:hypothetical protein